MEEEIQLLKREVEKLKDMFSPIDPHDRAKQRMAIYCKNPDLYVY